MRREVRIDDVAAETIAYLEARREIRILDLDPVAREMVRRQEWQDNEDFYPIFLDDQYFWNYVDWPFTWAQNCPVHQMRSNFRAALISYVDSQGPLASPRGLLRPCVVEWITRATRMPKM